MLDETVANENISLERFVEEEYKRLREFVQYWQTHQRELPGNYPNMLPPGEWNEQLIAFEGTDVEIPYSIEELEAFGFKCKKSDI